MIFPNDNMKVQRMSEAKLAGWYLHFDEYPAPTTAWFYRLDVSTDKKPFWRNDDGCADCGSFANDFCMGPIEEDIIEKLRR